MGSGENDASRGGKDAASLSAVRSSACAPKDEGGCFPRAGSGSGSGSALNVNPGLKA